ncbi:MAG: ZPR1 zinc finger domain-containing protein [Promethearchaeota archaeon]|nr:MAG: ZPR1 zinc finger domain-containing protein [Candidatus Lokiarchaeota archaeon]
MQEKNRNTEEKLTNFKCPACKDGDIVIKKIIYDLPDKDKMLILKFKCNRCDFENNDIIPLTTRMDAGIITLKITEENDLKSKIYRSPTGNLEIPELELKVEPGPSAEFYYTNVEGILLRFERAVSIYLDNLEDANPEKSEIKDTLKDLQKAMKGQLEFTLKIADPSGGSYIIPEDRSKYTFKKIENFEINKE